MICGEPSVMIFFVNGKKVVDHNVDPEWTLLYYLRHKLRLCGTKLGCAEGGCGACTVMVSKFDRKKGKIVHLAINACLAPVCSMHGCAVTTVEGIGSTETHLHPVQERIAKAHGSQCGFCTPGIVMSMYTLLRNSKKPSINDLELAFQGNLCRCTGYRPIIEAYKTFTEDWEVMQNENGNITNGYEATNDVCGMGTECCKVLNGKTHNNEEEGVLFKKSEFIPYHKSQEPIFPPELKLYDILDKQNLYFAGKRVEWYRPIDLLSLLELKAKYPNARIIVGNTEVGVEVKFKNFIYPVLIQPDHIVKMTEVKYTEYGIIIGASVTLQQFENVLKERINCLPEYKTRVYSAIVDMLHWFAGSQIRNVAAIGGNIMTGSPISDLNPIFLAASVTLEVQSISGKREIKMDENFFISYRKNIIKNDEVLTAIHIPYTQEFQYFYAYKQARRRDDDIAIVNSAFNVLFESNTNIIKDIHIVFGGMAPTTIKAIKTQTFLVGLPWSDSTIEDAYKFLIEDIPLTPSAPGGMINYRRSLTLSFFFRFFLAVSKEMQSILPDITIESRNISAIDGFHSKELKSSQYFQIVPKTQEKMDFIGRPIVHISAYKQATGEAIYCDDIPVFENELYCAFVYSTTAYANVLSIDLNAALEMKGVHGFFSAKDLKKHQNSIGPVSHDEEVFISKTVTSQGQIIAAVIAENQLIAQQAAKMVKVEYEELKPVLVTIEDAIKYQSFHHEPRRLEKGNIDAVFAEAPHIIEGSCRTGGQEHFYLETQCTIAVPKKEDNEMEIYCSTQHPSEVTALVAHVLEIPQNRVITKVKRMGGGFGGKESRAVAVCAPVAFAANRLNRPVRMMLDRDEDMLMTGGRHPFYMKYKVAFDQEGKILGCEVHLYANAGYSRDLSTAVLERAILHVQNAYNIPAVRLIGYICKTNIHTNTAFRGFGGPQGMFAAECMVRDVADYLKKNVIEISGLNLYSEGDSTFYNKKMNYCTIRRCWEECILSSNYAVRNKEIDIYNRENRWKKRGIAVVPTMYGISFTIPFLNQAGALVLVYTDGSVLLSHGGTEMGQGLHTKMIQIASRVLGIATSKIHISETSTDKVPNTSPTAASSGSDLNGPAVMNACEIINERLKPIKERNPKGTWEEWIKIAYVERVSLSATGFYATPNINFVWEKNSGNPFNYFTNGVACTEVEVDCLTGDHQVLRTDIVMDIGESINPAIDIGQIEGAFMQGYGLFMMEEMVYSPKGSLFTKGPGTYKIPGFTDIPREFNVSLLKGAPNPRAVYSSKAVGEPPLFLSSSVLFAAKEAIKAARKDAGINEPFNLDAPATAAKLRMACQDNFTSKFKEPEDGSYVPWNVIP